MTPTADELAAFLGEILLDLGDSSRKGAVYLQHLGIRGERFSCNTCPVAVYVLRRLQELNPAKPASVLVRQDELTVRYPGVTVTVTVDLPDAVVELIEAIDMGCWPQLEAVS